MTNSIVQDHADVVGQLRLLADIVLSDDVATAFVASLSSRRLDARSALGSYAFARVLPDHALDPSPNSFATVCRVCGWSQMPAGHEALEAQNAEQMARERTRWGGVRHFDPDYALFDLTEWRGLPPLNPTSEDTRCLELLLRTPGLLTPEAKATELERAIRSLLPSNKYERQTLIRILGYAGVLEASGYPSFFDSYVLPDARHVPHQRFVEWGYPIIWWRARDGIRKDAAAFWFGESVTSSATNDP